MVRNIQVRIKQDDEVLCGCVLGCAVSFSSACCCVFCIILL